MGACLLPHTRGGWGTLLWLAGLCAVLVRIEFEVGEGHTRPVQLIFVPMLLVLSPGLVPLAILLAHLPAPMREGRCGASGRRSACCWSARTRGSRSPPPR